MLQEQNQATPKKPTEAVCNDGSFAYRIGLDDFRKRQYSDGHSGVKQLVNNQYIGFDGEKILTQQPEPQVYKPPKQDFPHYRLHPVVIDLGKAVDKTKLAFRSVSEK